MGEDQVNAAIGFGMGGIVLLLPLLVVYPTWRCLRRAGYKPAWSLLVLIPIFGLFVAVGIFTILAFAKWPAIHGRAEPTSWSAFSSTQWTELSAEDAARNRHYGFDGVLLAMYGLFVVSTVPTLFNLFSGFYQVTMRISYGLTETGAFLMGLSITVWMLLILVFMPIRKPFVPTVIVALSWLYAVVMMAVIFGFVDPDAPRLAEGGGFNDSAFSRWFGAVSSVAFAFLSSWYWLKSKRVNVTYRYRVPAA